MQLPNEDFRAQTLRQKTRKVQPIGARTRQRIQRKLKVRVLGSQGFGDIGEMPFGYGKLSMERFHVWLSGMQHRASGPL